MSHHQRSDTDRVVKDIAEYAAASYYLNNRARGGVPAQHGVAADFAGGYIVWGWIFHFIITPIVVGSGVVLLIPAGLVVILASNGSHFPSGAIALGVAGALWWIWLMCWGLRRLFAGKTAKDTTMVWSAPYFILTWSICEFPAFIWAARIHANYEQGGGGHIPGGFWALALIPFGLWLFVPARAAIRRRWFHWAQPVVVSTPKVEVPSAVAEPQPAPTLPRTTTTLHHQWSTRPAASTVLTRPAQAVAVGSVVPGDPEAAARQSLHLAQKNFTWTVQGLHTAAAAIAPFAGSFDVRSVPVAELKQACAFLDRALMIQQPARDTYARTLADSLCNRLPELRNGLLPVFVIIAVAMAADAEGLA